ncbi:MAG: PAS domain S-box protein, partial [Deltaproteobacteria bacterium]|nr:PAS domain S-box protein [Deltaproteobacteria bacterium]MDL1961833.1 PAS domain S-box protein [Deltaproteobacteria bacterium]
MMQDKSIKERYFAVLKAHVANPDERYLVSVAELGRELLMAGIPTEEIAEIHEEALTRLAEENRGMKLIEATRTISEPLMELLIAYGMAFREQVEARRLAMEALKARNQELNEINARLRLIVESNRRLTSLSLSKQIGPHLLEEFARNMKATGGSLYLREEHGLVLIHSLGPEHAPSTILFPLPKNSVFEHVMMKGEAIFIKDIEHESRVVTSGWEGYNDGSLIVFPLRESDGEFIGLISLHNRISPSFVPQDLEIGIIMAAYTSEVLKATKALHSLQESEKKYRTFIETTSEGYWLIDLEHKILEVNQSLCDMLGYSRQEIIGKTPLDFVDDKNRNIFKSQMRQIKDTFHCSYEITLKSKTGEDIYT